MFLLDTNVVSQLRRRSNYDRHVSAWANNMDAIVQFLSIMTVRELEYGALLAARKDPRKGEFLSEWVADVLTAFKDRILPIDTDIALRCAALHVPDPRPERDSWIAATALVHDLTVVTRNTRDFAVMGVKLLDPWQAPA